MNISPQIYYAIELARRYERLDHIPPVYLPNSQKIYWKTKPPCPYFNITKYHHPYVWISYIYGNLGADHLVVDLVKGYVKMVAIS